MRLALVAVTFLAACSSPSLGDAGGGGGGGGSGPACATLDEAACAARSDCAADKCQGCDRCAPPHFFYCRASSAPPNICPGFACPSGPCDDANTCSGTKTCSTLTQGTSISCCGCAGAHCSADSDCTSGQVCDETECHCGKLCVSACAVDSCPAGTRCGSDGHCAPELCINGCATGFECDAGSCLRQACAASSDCGDGGTCVEGACYGFSVCLDTQ
jgi:hypothetical protein